MKSCLLVSIKEASHLAPLAACAVEHLGQLGNIKVQRVWPYPQDWPVFLVKPFDMDVVVPSSHEKESPQVGVACRIQ